MNSISKIASELRIYIVGNHRQASNLAVIEEAIGEIIYSETHEVAYDGRETVLKRNKFNNSVSKFTKFNFVIHNLAQLRTLRTAAPHVCIILRCTSFVHHAITHEAAYILCILLRCTFFTLGPTPLGSASV